MPIFTGLEKIIQKFLWKYERPQIPKGILSKKNNAGSEVISDFKLHYWAIVTNIVEYWHKNELKKKWNRVEDTEKTSHCY